MGFSGKYSSGEARGGSLGARAKSLTVETKVLEIFSWEWLTCIGSLAGAFDWG